MKEQTLGGRFIKWIRRTPETQQEVRDANGRFNATKDEAGNIFNYRTAAIESHCHSILQKAGRQAGSQAQGEYTEESCASEILTYIQLAKAAIQSGDALAAANNAWIARTKWANADLEFQWGKLVLMGADWSKEQQKKSVLATRSRWGGKDQQAEIIGRLSRKIDGLGDPIASRELWPLFYSELERMGQNPVDTSGREIKDGDRMTWDGDTKGITFKTFENNIAAARKRLSPK